MNEINIKMTAGQVAIVLDLLKPYTELSMSLSNQYKQQLIQNTMPVRAKKADAQLQEESNGDN